MLTGIDMKHLHRCVEPAGQALAADNPPFGSLSVSADGAVVVEDYNDLRSDDPTHHLKMSMARWATAHLAPAARARTTVNTAGDHGVMCAVEHGRTGLWRIACATSSAQLAERQVRWQETPRPRVRNLSIRHLLNGVGFDNPARQLVDEIHELHRRFFQSTHATE